MLRAPIQPLLHKQISDLTRFILEINNHVVKSIVMFV